MRYEVNLTPYKVSFVDRTQEILDAIKVLVHYLFVSTDKKKLDVCHSLRLLGYFSTD